MKFLGQDVAFQENLLFSFRRYLVWWLILLVTMVFDCLTTLYFVDKRGVNAEANYAVRTLITLLGPVVGVLIGKLLQLIPVILFVGLHRRLGNLFMLVIILLNCWAVVINTII